MTKQSKKEGKLSLNTQRKSRLKRNQKESLRFSDSVDNCNVYQFKMVHNTKDVRYLYILDSYEALPDSSEGLHDAWSSIYNKWGELTNSGKTNFSFLKQKRQVARKYDYNYQMTIYKMVQQFPYPELIDLFNSLGFKVDLKNYEQTMKMAYGKMQRDRANIELSEPKQHDGIDFDELLTMLEKEQGYGFDERTMTVRKLATIYKQVNGRRKDQKRGLHRRSGDSKGVARR